MRETPDAVVLLDEFEKAHGDVHIKFLTAWNDGYVTEALDGRQVSTNRSIFMLTSNAATEPLTEIAQRYRDSPDEMRPASIAALRAAGFAPEVLNRQLYRAVDVPTEGPTGWDWSRVMATPERLARATQIRDWAAAWWPLVETRVFRRPASCSATALMAGPRQQDGRSLRGATMA